MHGRRTGRGPRIRPHNHATIVRNRHDGCLATHTEQVSQVAFGQIRGGITVLEGAGGRTPMSTGCLRKSRVVSRDWSRSPLTCPPECSMILCGSMSSRSTKEAVLGGPENMVCARRGLRFGSVLGAGVVGSGLLVLLVPLSARAPSCVPIFHRRRSGEGPNYKYFFTCCTRVILTHPSSHFVQLRDVYLSGVPATTPHPLAADGQVRPAQPQALVSRKSSMLSDTKSPRYFAVPLARLRLVDDLSWHAKKAVARLSCSAASLASAA